MHASYKSEINPAPCRKIITCQANPPVFGNKEQLQNNLLAHRPQFWAAFLQDGVQFSDNVSKMQTQAVFVNSPICIDVFGSLKNPWE